MGMRPEDPIPHELIVEAEAEQPSLARNSLARLLSEGTGLVFGLIGGIITARWLGPAGKGAYAALTFLLIAFSQAASAGLGDAAVILVGKRKATIQRAVAATLGPLLLGAAAGATGLVVFALLQIGARGPTLGNAIQVAALTLPVLTYLHTLSFMLSAQERIVAASIVRSVTHVLTAAGLVAFVVVIPLHITGSLLAVAMASSAGLLLVVAILYTSGISLRPRWDWDYLRAALRYGPVLQLAYLVMIMSTRVDVLLVYALAGRAPAGHYSVALTLGQIAIYAASALVFAAYPRLARTSPEAFVALTARLSRVTIAASAVLAAVLVVAIPVLTPLVFGREYVPSIGPALVLLAGGVLWSEQWLLCRAWAAQGSTGLKLRSFGASVVVMVALDYLLIPPFGVMGAAFASVAGQAAGVGICIRTYKKALPDLELGQFLPGPADLRDLWSFAAGAFRGSDAG